MEFVTQTCHLDCPYCGERIEVVVDLSVENQEYIEDCSVCCRPMTLMTSVMNGDAHVSARHENESG
ncbi:MAG: CPXCG motif-containing cysteine-rich protein [Proteobacteria bacterium]|nr:CPXCG motif-containing cysteine-rich protein [Pseudomonadota bacterium]